METTIYLVRHGQTDSNASGRFQGKSDVKLNENGYHQARMLALRLNGEVVDAIYTSPLIRTKATAAPIAVGHELTPLVLPELAEINYGDWEGKSRKEVGEKWPELLWKMRNDPEDAAIPNGETFGEFFGRCNRAFQQITRDQAGKKVVVVAHSGVIKAILVEILGGVTSNWGKLDIDNTSITTVKITDDAIRVTCINDTSHLVTPEETAKEAALALA